MQEVQGLGRRYVAEMQKQVPTDRRETTTRIVDKMLRNVWNIGYIQMLLPQACIIQVSPAFLWFGYTAAAVMHGWQHPLKNWPHLDPANQACRLPSGCAKPPVQ